MNKCTSLQYAIALYIRLSVEDSKVESLSVENQKKLLHEFAESLEGAGHAEIREFVDNGYTGTHFERPAIQKILDLVRAGKINCIIVKDFSRFGRNSIEVGYFIERVFPLYGVRFISINDDFDTSRLLNDTGGMNTSFKYLLGEFYSWDLSNKITSAVHEKMRRGEYQSSNCPYGYRKGSNGRMEPDENTAPNVRLIFELASEGCNIPRIIKALFEKGVPTPSQYKAASGDRRYDTSRCLGVWPVNSIRNILADERYTGTYVTGRFKPTEVGSSHYRPVEKSQWIRIPGHHPAIISRELFDQAQARKRHIKSGSRKIGLYPLRCKVFCGCCSHTMRRMISKRPAFYCIHTRVDESFPCHGLKIKEHELETMIYEILSRQARIILNVDSLTNVEDLDIKLAEQTEYGRQIDELQDQKRALYERLLLKEIQMEEYKRRKAEIDAELNRIEQLHSILSVQTAQMKMDGEAKAVRMKLARDVANADALTAEIADALLEKVYVYPQNQVEIIWKIKDFCVEETNR